MNKIISKPNMVKLNLTIRKASWNLMNSIKIEVETKIFNVTAEMVLNRFLKMSEIFCGDITSYYYNYEDKIIRINEEETHHYNPSIFSYITIKKPIKSNNKFLKSCEEINVAVPSLSNGIAIFEMMGLERVAKIEKHRKSFNLEELEDIRLDFDLLSDSNTFWLEIEGDTEEKVMNAVKYLGYKMENLSAKTTKEIAEKKLLTYF